jgi:hypothetical protein
MVTFLDNNLNQYTLYAIRSNDIYPSLAGLINAEVSTKLKRTKDIGSMSHLVKLLKVLPQVTELAKVEYFSANAGIEGHALNHYLRELSDLGYCNLKSGNKLEISIPYSSLDVYEGLGNKLESFGLNEIELQHFELLNTIVEIPTKSTSLTTMLDLKPNELSSLKQLGEIGGYLDTYISPADATEILFSPIYWDENPESLFSLVEKYEEMTVLNKIKTIRKSQGKPINNFSDDPILTEAVALGCLPTNSVVSKGGEQFFAFTPNLGVKLFEKDMIKKARQIVASVRYGENFAVITRIRSALAVLRKLLRVGSIGGHSENIHQYAMLIQMGLVYPKPTFGDRNEIHLNDKPENRRVFELAIELLENGTLSDDHAMTSDTEELEKVFREGKTFSPELSVRTKFKREIPPNSDNLQKFGDIIRGVDVDVFK